MLVTSGVVSIGLN